MRQKHWNDSGTLTHVQSEHHDYCMSVYVRSYLQDNKIYQRFFKRVDPLPAFCRYLHDKIIRMTSDSKIMSKSSNDEDGGHGKTVCKPLNHAWR